MTREHGWSSLCLRCARLQLRQAAEQRFPTGATTYMYTDSGLVVVGFAAYCRHFWVVAAAAVNATTVVNEWVRGQALRSGRRNADALEGGSRTTHTARINGTMLTSNEASESRGQRLRLLMWDSAGTSGVEGARVNVLFFGVKPSAGGRLVLDAPHPFLFDPKRHLA